MTALLLLGTNVIPAQVRHAFDIGAKVLWSPVVGSGALYEIHSDGEGNGTMEVAVLGRERVNGEDAFWIEFTGKRPGKAQWVMKFLETGDASHPRIFRRVFQLAGGPAMEMPVPKSPAPESNVPNSDLLGRETLSVPAGTFACDHYRSKNGSVETWLNEKVVPWGLVKEHGKEKGSSWSMILLRTFTGAHDRITGNPQPFDPRIMQVPKTQP
jgi:hypothetical protein